MKIKHQTKLREGFTLIELLVVISIFALLASVVLVAVNSSRENARVKGSLGFAAQIDRAVGDQVVGLWDFDECSGATAKDRTFGNDLTLQNGASWSTDTPSGKGCSLSLSSAADQYASGPDADVFDIHTGSVTRTMWFKTTMTARGVLFKKSDSGNSNGMTIEINSSAGSGLIKCMIGSIVGGVSSITPLPYTDGKWHFVACVLDRTADTLKVYVDGGLKFSANASILSPFDFNASLGLYIGSQSLPGADFDGLIDSVHMFNKNLTAQEIQKIYYAEGGETRFFADKTR